MIGLVRPTRGEINFDGHNLAALSDKELTAQRMRFGFVFQGAALFDSMTIGQNVAFPLHAATTTSASRRSRRSSSAGWPKSDCRKSIVHKKPAELSGGMRKRVGLARALAMDPEVMLYDEPTTGLDPIMSDVINELILRTRRRYPVTSVVVTHDMHTAHKVADRIVMFYPLAAAESRTSRRSSFKARRPRSTTPRPARDAIRRRRGGRTTDGNAQARRQRRRR